MSLHSTVSTRYNFFFHYFPLGTISQKCRKRAVGTLGHQWLDRRWGTMALNPTWWTWSHPNGCSWPTINQFEITMGFSNEISLTYTSKCGIPFITVLLMLLLDGWVSSHAECLNDAFVITHCSVDCSRFMASSRSWYTFCGRRVSTMIASSIKQNIEKWDQYRSIDYIKMHKVNKLSQHPLAGCVYIYIFILYSQSSQMIHSLKSRTLLTSSDATLRISPISKGKKRAKNCRHCGCGFRVPGVSGCGARCKAQR